MDFRLSRIALRRDPVRLRGMVAVQTRWERRWHLCEFRQQKQRGCVVHFPNGCNGHGETLHGVARAGQYGLHITPLVLPSFFRDSLEHLRAPDRTLSDSQINTRRPQWRAHRKQGEGH